MATKGGQCREALAGCSPVHYLRALKSSQSIQVFAGAAHIANQGGLGVLGSCPYELSAIRMWELQGFCVFCSSVKSASLSHRPFLLPFPTLSLFPFCPPPKPQKLVAASTREAVSVPGLAHKQIPVLPTRAGPWAFFLAQESQACYVVCWAPAPAPQIDASVQRLQCPMGGRPSVQAGVGTGTCCLKPSLPCFGLLASPAVPGVGASVPT